MNTNNPSSPQGNAGARAYGAQQAKHAGFTFTAGQRVMDIATKEQGEIINAFWSGLGQIENYTVMLDSRELVKRSRGQLVAIPSNLRGALEDLHNPQL